MIKKSTLVVHLLQIGTNYIQTTDEFVRRRVNIEPESVCVLSRHSRAVPDVVERLLPEFVGIFEVDKQFRGGLIDLIVPSEEPQEPKGARLQSLGRCARPPHGRQKGIITVLQSGRSLGRVETGERAISIS